MSFYQLGQMVWFFDKETLDYHWLKVTEIKRIQINNKKPYELYTLQDDVDEYTIPLTWTDVPRAFIRTRECEIVKVQANYCKQRKEELQAERVRLDNVEAAAWRRCSELFKIWDKNNNPKRKERKQHGNKGKGSATGAAGNNH